MAAATKANMVGLPVPTESEASIPMMNSRPRIPLSPTENLVVGAFGGALETSLQMPIMTTKFCWQEGRPLPTTLAGFYRGVGVQAGSVAPLTALQFSVNGLLQKVVRVARPGNDAATASIRALTDAEMIVTAAGAGAISALAYTPVDLLTIQQQKLEKNVLDTGRYIVNNFGFRGLFRGLMACAVRESIYTAGYLGLAPVLSSRLVQDVPALSDRPFVAGVLGACGAGITAAILTHPFDTAKTCMQSDMSGTIWPTARYAIPKLIAEGGISNVFRGMVPRTIRMCGAFFVCMTLQDMAIGYKTDQFYANN